MIAPSCIDRNEHTRGGRAKVLPRATAASRVRPRRVGHRPAGHRARPAPRPPSRFCRAIAAPASKAFGDGDRRHARAVKHSTASTGHLPSIGDDFSRDRRQNAFSDSARTIPELGSAAGGLGPGGGGVRAPPSCRLSRARDDFRHRAAKSDGPARRGSSGLRRGSREGKDAATARGAPVGSAGGTRRLEPGMGNGALLCIGRLPAIVECQRGFDRCAARGAGRWRGLAPFPTPFTQLSATATRRRGRQAD